MNSTSSNSTYKLKNKQHTLLTLYILTTKKIVIAIKIPVMKTKISK